MDIVLDGGFFELIDLIFSYLRLKNYPYIEECLLNFCDKMSVKNCKSKSATYAVCGEYKTLADSNVRLLLEQLDLSRSAVKVVHTGSKPSETNTVTSYLKHIRGLRYFCSLIGDYESLLLLDEYPQSLFAHQ